MATRARVLKAVIPYKKSVIYHTAKLRGHAGLRAIAEGLYEFGCDVSGVRPIANPPLVEGESTRRVFMREQDFSFRGMNGCIECFLFAASTRPHYTIRCGSRTLADVNYTGAAVTEEKAENVLVGTVIAFVLETNAMHVPPKSARKT